MRACLKVCICGVLQGAMGIISVWAREGTHRMSDGPAHLLDLSTENPGKRTLPVTPGTFYDHDPW
jgi:hypothetical protein